MDNKEQEFWDLEKKIYEAAGCEFDIFDDYKTREVLVEKLGLPNNHIEFMADKYPIVADILKYREIGRASMKGDKI